MPPLEIPGTIADRTQRFVGRRSTLEKVAGWLKAPPEGNRFLVLTGEPGSGKSAFMGWLAGAGPDPADPDDAALRRTVREALDAVHFCVAASGGALLEQFRTRQFNPAKAFELAALHPCDSRLSRGITHSSGISQDSHIPQDWPTDMATDSQTPRSLTESS
jgi:energy-coupling factor transporter ATP-binding protein EcfA2